MTAQSHGCGWTFIMDCPNLCNMIDASRNDTSIIWWESHVNLAVLQNWNTKIATASISVFISSFKCGVLSYQNVAPWTSHQSRSAFCANSHFLPRFQQNPREIRSLQTLAVIAFQRTVSSWCFEIPSIILATPFNKKNSKKNIKRILMMIGICIIYIYLFIFVSIRIRIFIYTTTSKRKGHDVTLQAYFSPNTSPSWEPTKASGLHPRWPLPRPDGHLRINGSTVGSQGPDHGRHIMRNATVQNSLVKQKLKKLP